MLVFILKAFRFLAIVLAVALCLTFGATLLGWSGWWNVVYLLAAFVGALLGWSLAYWLKFRQDRKSIRIRTRM